MGLVSVAMEQKTNMYDFVMHNLRAKAIPQRTVALESGVPFSTVCKIAQGLVKDPSVHTVQKLFDYFMPKAAVDVAETEKTESTSEAA
jgi:predicted transcriptional regulator